MAYSIIRKADSRSFPAGDAFLAKAAPSADVVLYLGAPLVRDASKAAILVELGNECLSFHLGSEMKISPPPGGEGLGVGGADDNVLGFARYRNGSDAPSNLVELVRLPHTSERAIAAAKAVFESAGLTVALCSDQAGRIIDRLVRPKYNAALRFLDEGLATQADMDTTCRLGLGYADGPLERVIRGGLAHHYDVTKSLFDIYGASAYAPARAAAVAAQIRDKKS